MGHDVDEVNTMATSGTSRSERDLAPELVGLAAS